MKRICLILFSLLLCVLLMDSCASTSNLETHEDKVENLESHRNERTDNLMDVNMGAASPTASFSTTDKIDNNKPLSDIITVRYNIKDLRSFFGSASATKLLNSKTSIQDIRISDANERFPIQFLRQSANKVLYTVYGVDEGGFYYVFWSGVFDPTSNVDEIIDWSVDFAIYLPATIKLTKDDFKSIIPGSSTAEDVSSIDPNYELNLLMSSQFSSYSLLADGAVLEIYYDFGESFESESDLIVTGMKLRANETLPSKLASIYASDLP